jgi:hypothetical protein
MNNRSYPEWIKITTNAVNLLNKQYEELITAQSQLLPYSNWWDYYDKLITKAIEYYETTIITAWNKLSPGFITKDDVIPNEVKRIQSKISLDLTLAVIVGFPFFVG